ncbi:zinc finger matrin-type protein 1 isoform X1 [Pangasianodon hypophthalmus]|uniref:zinc finger matrin-type protein 1 isoform X1 n=2 Tax=Pangasianodon hypophthalmus TaxID=310915 RepID=UPI0023075ED7|nr:zinc finger matrin-type protein 1 isoform X1 [Pangasianodon hypophthalmus]XP_034167277.2 zinc finger matrin-type protein 1 isoform X1 [Pangasianodon hypophthalmus]XP_053096251.1 zinc finger matrin-type protein 1 isoform X1 [Pangasianodon hypophthalmus]XP_053096252.1 zinc finger matrin-type protein 1 isoform X1 [Pangasianodon hypophthalmus]
MSVSEDSVSCPTENSVTVHLDSASVSDAETVLKNTNVHSCHVEEETQNDDELLKGLLTDTFCQVCEAVLMFESQRVSHYEGKKHAQRVRIYLQTKKAERNKQSHESGSFQSVSADPEKFCELCNMVFSSPVVAKSHYEGKVHAKNTRKSSTTSSVVLADARTTVSSAAPPVTAVEDTVETSAQDDGVQEEKESTASASQGVDLSDPEKYCKLCAASFNNPMMASEHYSGRKHQRNLARQELHSKLGEQSEHANSLTCPLCHVTLSSIDTYQAHMKGNKHYIKEKKIQEDLCKKKVYDSFQDELADYIQVQRSRGLEPKTGQGSETQGQRKAETEVDESGECCDQPQILPLQSRLPAPAFRAHPWRPPFHPHPNPAAFRGRFPVPNQWDQGNSSYPPPLIPGLTGRALRRGRSPESFSSSSSFSDSSSSYSSSSSSSEDSRERRRWRKKRRDGMKKRREEEDDSEEDVQRKRRERRRREDGSAKKPKRQRESSDEDHGKRWKEKKHKERVTKKRRREEDEGEWNRVSHVEMTKGEGEGEAQSEGLKEEKAKHKKEKKKPKDREDNRTEEEKLWDETILGIF